MTARPVGRSIAQVARVVWLILPVVAAGSGHVVVLKTNVLGFLAIPIDGNLRWRDQPILGVNKTWRGVLVMTALTALATRAQWEIGNRRSNAVFGLTREYRGNPWRAGGLMGLSYSLAELPNSFVKRRLHIAPGTLAQHAGRLQYVVDQADSVVGCLLGLRFFYRPRRGETVLAFALGTAVHIGVDQLMIYMGVKRRHG